MRTKEKIWSSAAAALWLVLFLTGPSWGRSAGHQVYVAFGLHVNLYHSYRVDRNDEGGFGKDIRIIREVIKTLDRAGRAGVPARAVWDFDNLFSLQKILPEYAPDIIRDLRRRVKENGDEIILMSYNNALGSALNRREFEASVTRAVSNDQGGGVLDLFGRFSPIVRPQEMMIGPGCFEQYRRLGVEAVVLYHSAITFDAFRLFARPLSRTEAFNPLTYRNEETGEEMTVIPAYNIGDLLENGSLARMAENLHQEQLRGEIDRDVLIFVNFDADDEFWAGYDLPWRLAWLPNTGGLKGLIDDAAELDYVRFTTLGKYLEDHPPCGEICFGQDLADGNFNGYNNWAEKELTPEIWTAVEADRRVHEIAFQAWSLAGMKEPPEDLSGVLEASFQKRLEILSTTNFGMSVPDVAPARRRVVLDAAEKLKSLDARALRAAARLIRQVEDRAGQAQARAGFWGLESFYLLGGTDDRGPGGFFMTLDLSGRSVQPGQALFLVGPDGGRTVPVRVEDRKDARGNLTQVRLFIPAAPGLGPYRLLAGPRGRSGPDRPGSVRASERELANNRLRVDIGQDGMVKGMLVDGRRVLGDRGMLPRIKYRTARGEETCQPERMKVEVLRDGSEGAGVLRLTAVLDLPGLPPKRRGWVDYYLTLLPDSPYLYLEVDIQYPQTDPVDLINGGHPALTGRIDGRWIEVAPVELRPALFAARAEPFRIHRENYLGVEASYSLDYFRHSDKNLDLADVNNHITGEYAAVTGINGGLAVAADTRLAANFAFCPMKVSHHQAGGFFTISLNPFGSYFGEQYVQPTWGDGVGYRTALAAGGQYRSSAPGFNGARQRFSLMLAFYEGPKPPERLKRDLRVFAHPPTAVSGQGDLTCFWPRRPEAPPETPLGLVAESNGPELFFQWTRPQGAATGYKLYLGRQSGRYDRVLTAAHNSLETTAPQTGRPYYAAVTAVGPDGKESPFSREIEIIPGQWRAKRNVALPFFLQLKLMTVGAADLLR